MKKTLMYSLLVLVVGICCAKAVDLNTKDEVKPETQAYEWVFVQDGKVIRNEKDWDPNKPFKQICLRIE